MKFKYRFKGKVNSQFVLRGMLFSVGAKMDFCVSESELNFIKEHCDVIEIIDLEQPTTIEPLEPMLETKTDNEPKEIRDELRTKRTSNVNKGKHKENL